MMKVLKVKGERLTGTRKLRENQKNKSRNQTKTMYRTQMNETSERNKSDQAVEHF